MKTVFLFVIIVVIMTTLLVTVDKFATKHNVVENKDLTRHNSMEKTILSCALYVCILSMIFATYILFKGFLKLPGTSDFVVAVNSILPAFCLRVVTGLLEATFSFFEKKCPSRFTTFTKNETKVLSYVATFFVTIAFLKIGEMACGLNVLLLNIVLPVVDYLKDWLREYNLRDTYTKEKPYRRPFMSFEKVSPFFLTMNVILSCWLTLATFFENHICVCILASVVAIILYIVCMSTNILISIRTRAINAVNYLKK